MGAWSYEVLTNDAALDMMGELEICGNLKDYLYDILHGESYIEEFLLAVEIIDISLNGIDETILGSFYDYEDWFKEVEKMDLNDLKDDAIHVVEYVQQKDYGWTDDVIYERRQMLKRIEKRLMGEAVVTEEEKEKSAENLVQVIKEKIARKDRFDIKIENMRIYLEEEMKFASADVSFLWSSMQGWVEPVEFKNIRFVLVDDEWKSPIF